MPRRGSAFRALSKNSLASAAGRVQRRDDRVRGEFGQMALAFGQRGDTADLVSRERKGAPHRVARLRFGIDEEDSHGRTRDFSIGPRRPRRRGLQGLPGRRILSAGQSASMRSFTSALMRISGGQGRSNPSPFHFRVASIPILLP